MSAPVRHDPLAWLGAAAEDRSARGLRRRLRPRSADDDILDLAGNDYLDLSRRPEVVEAAVTALRTWGAGATGSRLVTGTTQLHTRLDAALAAFVGTPSAVVSATGYAANLAAVTALSGPGSLIVSDAHNHASLVDACRLSRASVVVTPHLDVAAVVAALTDRSQQRALVVTDSLFSVDGALAPLAELHAACREHGAVLIADEAHALGVVGDGRGAAAAAGIAGEPDVVLTMSLSKALGAQGGAVLGRRDVVDHLVDTARAVIFDTGLAPASVGAALASLRIIDAEPALPQQVRSRAADLAAIFGVPAPAGAVVRVPVGDATEAIRLQTGLAERGVRVACFRAPTVPEGEACLRLAARATLTFADLTRVRTAWSAVR